MKASFILSFHPGYKSFDYTLDYLKKLTQLREPGQIRDPKLKDTGEINFYFLIICYFWSP